MAQRGTTVLVATHEYMLHQGRRSGVGNKMWRSFVRRHKNIFMVVSGHIIGWSHRTSQGDAGICSVTDSCSYSYRRTKSYTGTDGDTVTIAYSSTI